MAMTSCKECNASISTKATQCPSCGVQIRRTSGCAWIALVVFAVPVVISIVMAFAQGPAPPTPEAQRAALPASECMKDTQCWGERNAAKATAACTTAVVNLAKWDHEWTDGIGRSKFGQWSAAKAPGKLIYSGDQLKLQNGFGAWQRVRYSCAFDPETGTATAFVAER